MNLSPPPVADLTWPPEAQRWPPVFPPVFACAWGDDRFGLWIDVLIGGPVQRFRWIEPGEFVMGSPEGEDVRFPEREKPQHIVRLTTGFWLADTSCSQRVWEAVMSHNPSRFNSNPDNPVDSVSWNDVQAFLNLVDAMLGVAAKAGLPTGAEWEYACRASSTEAFNWGSNSISPKDANYDFTKDYAVGMPGVRSWSTVPVKSFRPNGWGLYQMHGNIWEWCDDSHRKYGRLPVEDPRGNDDGKRVMRGGSWYNYPEWLRSAYSIQHAPDKSEDSHGFRLLIRSLCVDEKSMG